MCVCVCACAYDLKPLLNCRVTRLVTGQTRHLVDERSQALTLRIRSQILCYMAVFLLTWFFPLINRTAIAIVSRKEKEIKR